MQLTDWVKAQAGAIPDRVAYRFSTHEVTFRQLDRVADDVAAQIGQFNVRHGDRVGLMLSPGYEFVAALHGICRIGATPVPLNPQENSTRLNAAIGLANISHVVADPISSDTLEPDSGHKVKRAVQLELAAGLDLVQISDVRVEQTPTPCFIVLTSGTAGKPKPIALTASNIWWSAFGAALNLGVSTDDVWLACMPFHHVGGLSIITRGLLYGNTVEIHETFDEERVMLALTSGQVTIGSLVGPMLKRILDVSPPTPVSARVRYMLVGGGPIASTLVDRSIDLGLPIAPTYGLTETSSQIATLPPWELSAHKSTVGRALHPTRVAISTASGPGEIRVHGPTIAADAAGYDGWLNTGDFGELSEDGYLTILDRRTDLIVTGGENVSPIEVETILRQHPQIEDLAVFGMQHTEWGQIVVAAMIPRGNPPTLQDVRGWSQARMAAFKVPKLAYIVESLPRNSGGKVIRRELPALVTDPARARMI